MSNIDENMVNEIDTTVEIEDAEDQKETSRLMDFAVVGGIMAAGVAVYKVGGIAYQKLVKPGFQKAKNFFKKGKDQETIEVPDEEVSSKKAEEEKSEAKNKSKNK